MKKGTLTWIAIILIYILFSYGEDIFIFLQESTWLPNDYARITELDYKAVLVDEPNSEGKVIVTEKITFDVHAASKFNGFYELWRDLSEEYSEGLTRKYKVNSVYQILEDGTRIRWDESPKLYWDDWDYEGRNTKLGPGKWFHSKGPYNEDYGRYECIFFYVDNLYREKVTFEIEYEMTNAVYRYGDSSDLYLIMFDDKAAKHLESFNAEILIPNKDMPREENYTVATYGTNADTFPVEKSANKNPGYYTFSFNLDKDELKFKPHNSYIEFELWSYGEDKHIFADYANKNYYYNDEALEEIIEESEYYTNKTSLFVTIKLIILLICVIITVIILLSGIFKVRAFRKRYPLYDEKVDSIDIFRDIPSDLDPKFASALVFCKDKKINENEGIYSALLLSLARKDYVEIKETSDGDTLIAIKDDGKIITDTNDLDNNITYDVFYNEESATFVKKEIQVSLKEPLTSGEEHYLNLLKRHSYNNKITLSVLQKRLSDDYEYTDSFAKNIDKVVIDSGVGLGYFQKAKYSEPKDKLKSSSTRNFIWGFIFLIIVNLIFRQTPIDLGFGGFTLIGIANVILAIYYRKIASRYILLTKFGETEYQKWRGLYNFLKSDTLINERTYIELPLWEKYLVYATAFGISEKVIEAIKIRCPEIEKKEESIVYSSYCRSGRYRSYGRSFHSSVRHSSSMHASSSYGGGGRGGYGGGGGH